MFSEADRKAVRALAEERGGQLLVERLQKRIQRIDQGWLRLIDDSKGFPDRDLLMIELLKARADKGANRRILAMLTAPSEENEDE